MPFIQGGATDTNGNLFASKKALKEAVAAHPNNVRFYVTRIGGQYFGPLSTLEPSDTLVVVGPDPETSRKWYANIKRGRDGKIKVS